MNGNNLSNVVTIFGTGSSDLGITATATKNLSLFGSNIGLTAFGTIDLTSSGATNISTSFSNAITINADGNLNLVATQPGKIITLYGPAIDITGTTTTTIRTNYSTWTGSNNFNILGSNIGITSSNAFDIVATGSGVLLDGNFSRKLSGTNISQPIIQYGTATGSGASGSVTVTLPVAYSSATSYVVTASMMDTTAARMSVNRNSASSITIYWFQAGSGSQTLGWNTMGT